MDTNRIDTNLEDAKACDGRLSRKEFLSTLVRRAALTGALLAAPKVIDKFIVPPAMAITSTLHRVDTKNSSDTNVFADTPSKGPATTTKSKTKKSVDTPDDFG